MGTASPSHSACRRNFLPWLVVGGALAVCTAMPAAAHPALTTAPPNLRWHAPPTSASITFLGKDEKETAVLVLKKSVVLDTEISIQSDATSINLSSGDSVHIALKVDAGTDGVTTRLRLGGGDQPALAVDDKENVRLGGKWIEIVTAKDDVITVSLEDATFATVKFDPKLVEPRSASSAGASSTRPSGGSESAQTSDSRRTSGAGRELLETIKPAKLKAAADAFANGVSRVCPHCNGKGTVVVSVQTGTREEGALRRPVYREETQTCDRCRGKGHLRSTDEVLNRLAGNFLKALASVDRDDPKTQDAISDSYKMITESMIGDYQTWILLTENGRSILSQRNPAVGTPVIAKCIVKEALPRVGDRRAYVVEIGGIDKLVQVFDPTSADELSSGAALMGGLVQAGRDGKPLTVLAQGFLIAPPVERTWWWWYWWWPHPPRSAAEVDRGH